MRHLSALIASLLVASAAPLRVQTSPPRDWVDPSTGHRVVRLTDDAGGSTLYFHDNAFSPEGDKLLVNTPNGLGVIEVAAIGTPRARVDLLVAGARGAYFARRTREIYYTMGTAAGAK